MTETDKSAEEKYGRQITQEQAIAIYNSGVWKSCTDEEIVRFQLFQDCLALPFGRFHEAVEKVLGRAVFTHEFAYRDELIREFLGGKPAPTFEEIMNLIPEEKRIILAVKP